MKLTDEENMKELCGLIGDCFQTISEVKMDLMDLRTYNIKEHQDTVIQTILSRNCKKLENTQQKVENVLKMIENRTDFE
jgi:hypothetical protein